MQQLLYDEDPAIFGPLQELMWDMPTLEEAMDLVIAMAWTEYRGDIVEAVVNHYRFKEAWLWGHSPPKPDYMCWIARPEMAAGSHHH